ncbi:MAG: AAA family ATPase [Bacteroides sp.]|nr:AAA family ATPase [Bacteroides sp.]
MFIFAGSNGAGKSTYYSTVINNENERQINKSLVNSYRINADEILRSNGGNWHKDSDNLKALVEEVRLINKYIDQKKSFNFETTLAASTKTYKKYIKEAKENGFKTVLIYVGLKSPNLAITRVKNRVNKGGHGIKDDLIIRRYRKSLIHLNELIFLFDEVRLFDNTDQFIEIYHRNNKNIILLRNGYEWAYDTIMSDKKRIEKL